MFLLRVTVVCLSQSLAVTLTAHDVLFVSDTNEFLLENLVQMQKRLRLHTQNELPECTQTQSASGNWAASS